MIDNLKPCPLCGGQAEWEYAEFNEKDETGDDGTGKIECQSCRLSLFGYDYFEAKRTWNRRSTTSESTPDGYALISNDVLREWGKLEVVQEMCCYPSEWNRRIEREEAKSK